MITGQLFKCGIFSASIIIVTVLIAVLLIKYGRNLQKVKEAQEKDNEYERMQKIHAAHSSMSASERLDWLRKQRKD